MAAELNNQIHDLKQKVESAFDVLNITREQQALEEYEREMAEPDFWQDSAIAQDVSQKHNKLKKRIQPWLDLAKELQELEELAKLGDDEMAKELAKQLDALTQRYSELEMTLKFSGKYDGSDATITIQAGAGGTDAQDWVQMLQKMYVKWAQARGLSVEIMAETPGDEAGLKNTTLRINGDYAYGNLRSEHGVHRLVRQSPFNAAASRETSFAMVEVVPDLVEPDEFGLDEAELKIDVYRASGRGGQSVNTTDSAVRVTHLPTGVTVAIQNERSQLQNKEAALKILRARLAQLAEQQHAEKLSDLKGPNVEAAWGNQIRNYVLHPYTLVKDTRTGTETSNVQSVLEGDIDQFINAYLTSSKNS